MPLSRLASSVGRQARNLRLRAGRLFLTSADREGARRADRICTHLTEEEKYSLLRLARAVPRGGVAVEIGSYLGASSCFLALGLRRRAGRLYCVDTWQNEAMSEGERDTFAEFAANTAPYRDTIIPLRGRSEIVGREFTPAVSLLFIDGDHSYEAVSRDYHTWLPRLAAGAVVALHDCGWAEGVQRLIAEEIRPRAARWRQTRNMAWGLLRRGE